EACSVLGLKYAVITSVNRDDRKDGGAELFARTIQAIRERVPGCKVEVLVPDFQGSHEAMDIVMNAHPDVLNHNTETVPRLYRQVRLGARYERSLDMLRYAKQLRPHVPTKSGRSAAGDARPAGPSRRYFDGGPISAAINKASAGYSLYSARRVRRLQASGTQNGLRTCGSGTASAKFISCGRGGRSGAGRVPALGLPHRLNHSPFFASGANR